MKVIQYENPVLRGGIPKWTLAIRGGRLFTHPYKTVQGSLWDCEQSYLSGSSILSATTLPPRLIMLTYCVYSFHNTVNLSCIATLLKDIVYNYTFEFHIHVQKLNEVTLFFMVKFFTI